MKILLTAIAVASLVATPAAGQTNVTGEWEMISQTPRGEITQLLILQQDGDSVTGTIERVGGGRGGGGGGRRGGPAQVESGSIDGPTITFTVVRSFGDRVFESEYVGTIDGDTITGTVVTPRGETDFSMTRVAT